MNNFSFQFTFTLSSAVSTVLCIGNHLPYKPRLDLNIYKSNELESTFIEIYLYYYQFIYKHSSYHFKTNYLNKLLNKVSKEQKSVFLLGDFNINLLQ